MAFWNVQPIFVTLHVSHPPISWLKAAAFANMALISVTLDVSHPPIFWLKAVAL